MESFEQIYTRYFKDVYRYIYSLCGNAMEAEEVTQETFFQAMKSIHSFRGECKMIVWLCQIAKHIYFAHQKKLKRESAQPPEETQTEAENSQSPVSLEQRLADEGDAMRIHEYLHALKEPYKEVFMLRVFGELSFKKIAHIFGKTENWARVSFYRAKVQIISEMEEGNGKDFL